MQAPTPCPAESHHEPSSPVSVLRWQGSSTTSSDPNSASTLCITEEDVKDVGSLAASLVSQVDLPTIARRRSGTSKAAAQPLSISSQVDLRSVLERSFGRGSLTPSTPPPTLATSAIHSAATTSDGEKDNYSGVGANVPHCEDHNDPACTASDTLASPQPSSFDETLPADLGPASDSDSDEGPSAFEHDVSDGAQVEEDDSVLAAVSQIRTQEDKVTIQGLPRVSFIGLRYL